MNFLKKRSVSVVLCMIMIVAAICVTSSRQIKNEQQAADENAAEIWAEKYSGSYRRFVSDPHDYLSEADIQSIAVQIAEMDYSHGSICAVAILGAAGDYTLEEAAYNQYDKLQLGSFDSLLLIVKSAEDWYFVSGPEFTRYADRELEDLIHTALDDGFLHLGNHLIELYDHFSDWYADNIPVVTADKISMETSFGSLLFVSLLVVLLIIVIVASIATGIARRFFGGFHTTKIFDWPTKLREDYKYCPGYRPTTPLGRSSYKRSRRRSVFDKKYWDHETYDHRSR